MSRPFRYWKSFFSSLGRVLRNRRQRQASAKRRSVRRRHELDALEPRVVLNAAPVAVDDDYVAEVGQAIQFDPTSNDTDPDGDPLEVVGLYGRPQHGSLTWNADGTFTYQPNSGFTGSETMQYFVSDGHGHEVQASFTISVNPPNTAPWVTEDTSSALGSIDYNDATPQSWTVSDLLDAYADGDETPKIGDEDNGLAGIALVGIDNAGVGTWQYSVDGGVTWLAVGAPSDTDAILLDLNAWLQFTPAADGSTGTASLSFRAWDGTDGGQSGDTNVDVSNHGGESAYSEYVGDFSFAITEPTPPENTAPVITTMEPVSLGDLKNDQPGPSDWTVADLISRFDANIYDDEQSNNTLGIAVYWYDADGAGEWQYSVDDGETWTALPSLNAGEALLLNSAAYLRYLANGLGDEGTATLSFYAWDGTTDENDTIVDLSTRGDETAFSQDGAELTLNVVDPPENTAPWVTEDTSSALGSIDYNDATPQSWTVGDLLDAYVDGDETPEIGDDDGDPVGIALVGAADAGVGIWQYSVNNGATWLEVGAPSDAYARLLDRNARLRFTPWADGATIGTASLSFRAWDGTDGADSGDVVDASIHGNATAYSAGLGAFVFHVTVPVNHDFSLTSESDSDAIHVDGAWTFHPLENVAEDEDGDVGFEILPGDGFFGTITDHGDGAFTYTPDGQEGTAVFVVRYFDADYEHTWTITLGVTAAPAPPVQPTSQTGRHTTTTIDLDWTPITAGAQYEIYYGLNGSTYEPDESTAANGPTTAADVSTATVDGLDPNTDYIFWVRAVYNGQYSEWVYADTEMTSGEDIPENSPPEANDVYVEGDQDSPIIGGYDASDPDGDALTYRISSGPSNGTAVDNGDGTFTYTPNPGFSGEDSFTYAANDGNEDSEERTVYVTVHGVNSPPEANDVYVEGDQDSPIIGGYDALDPDGDALTYRISSGPSNGTVLDNGDGTFTYTPAEGFSGEDSFTYVANDGTDDSNEAVVYLTVNYVEQPVNTPPEAGDVYAAGDQGASITGGYEAWDADGDALTYRISSGPSNGTVLDNGDGTFTYTPAEGFNGEDSFTYVANDGINDSGEATVYIVVHFVNAPPTANDVSVNGDQGNPVIAGYDASDPDGDALTYWISSGPSNGTAVDNGDGTFTYTPNPGFSGEDSFTYVANDGTNDSGEATVHIFVNSPPVANDVYVEGEHNIPIIGGYDASDAESNFLTYRITSGPSSGTVIDNGDGTFTYTPAEGFSGEDSFTYVANDGTRDSEEATVHVTVHGPNMPPSAADVDVEGNQGEPIVGSFDASDDEGDELTYRITSGPINGTVVDNGDGTFTYTAAEGFSGEDSFTYVANDGTEDSEERTVYVTIHRVETPLIIDDFTGGPLGAGLPIWVFQGHVSGEYASGASITFGGLLEGYFATVQADGSFELTASLEEGEFGIVTAIATDALGNVSNEVGHPIVW